MSVLFPVAVWAQEVEPAQTTGTDEEVITLSAFEVSDDALVGYATTSSLSASRVSTPITDIAGSVITINEKLIEDTLAENLGDTLNLISGITTTENSELAEISRFAIRGYISTGAQRDGIPEIGFNTQGGFDYSLFERIEVIKGPAGVQYGQHDSGGVVNLISNRPLLKKRTKISYTYGSYNTWRAAIDHSNMIEVEGGNKFGYRISGALLNTDGVIALGSETDKPASWFINPSISYDFKNGAKLWAQGIFVEDQSSRMASNAFIFGTPDGRGRANLNFAGKSSINVENFKKNELTNFELGLTHAFEVGEVDADFRLLGRFSEGTSTGNRTRANDNVVIIAKDGTQIPDGSPSVGRGPNMYEAVQGAARFGRQGVRGTMGADDVRNESIIAVDLNLTFDIGPAKNKLLIYSQFRDIDSDVGSLDVRINNSGTLPPEIRKEFGFETGVFIDPARIVDLNIYDPDLPLAQQLDAKLSGLKTGAQRTADDCWNIGAITDCHQGIVEIWPNPYSGTKSLIPVLEKYANLVYDRGSRVQSRSLKNFAAINRTYLFDDRVIAVFGFRKDTDDAITQTILLNVTTPVADTTDESTTYNYGLVGKIFQEDSGEVALFYNYAETFIPVFSLDSRIATFGERFPNQAVATDEIGVKVDFWGSRVVGTLSYFDTVQSNILVGIRDEDGSVTGVNDSSYKVPAGNQTTEGWEMDLWFNPMPGLNAIVSYGTLDSMIADGLPAWNIPESTFSFLVNYQFQEGPLKNFSITPSYKFWGASQLNRASNFKLPAGDLWTVVFGYRWENMNIRLRIENVDDDIDSQPATWWTGAGATKGRNYRLGVDYTF